MIETFLIDLRLFNKLIKSYTIMKIYKYVLAGALMLGAVVPVMAQDNVKAIAEQAAQIAKAKGPDYDKEVKQLYKDNKKNPEALVAIGRAFYNAKDLTNADLFADYAIQKKSSYAPAFLLKGDICVSKDDAGGAATNYQQAKYFAPKDPEAYYKYAMILRGRSPEEAVSNLEDLRKQLPDYPVDALAGRIYYHSNVPNHFEKAAEYYSKVADPSKMDDEDITNFSVIEWLLGNHDKSITAAKAGLQKDPRRAGWNRLVFYNYTDANDPQNALIYADKLFNQSDSAHITADDYAYYGTAYQENKQWDEAIAQYNKALDELKTDTGARVTNTILYKNISDIYNQKGDFDKSLDYLEQSINSKPNQSLEDYDNLGRLYTDIAAKKAKSGDKSGEVAAFKKADVIYAQILQKFPNYENYGNYMRAQINANLDPDSKQGLAKPYYEKLVNSLENKSDKSNSETQMLKQAYFYLMVYEINTAHNVSASKGWANKLLTIDPNEENAKQVLKM